MNKLRLVGSLRFGIDVLSLASADLATNAAQTKSVLSVRNALLHVSHKLFGPRVATGIDYSENYVVGYTSASDVSLFLSVLSVEAPGRGMQLRF
jgi:hypothetical protein